MLPVATKPKNINSIGIADVVAHILLTIMILKIVIIIIIVSKNIIILIIIVIVKASQSKGVSKCAENVFEGGKIVKGEGL